MYTWKMLFQTDEGTLCIVLLFVVFILWFYFDSLSKPKENDKVTGKKYAMYPKVDKKLLAVAPTGIVFGKWKKRYVCKRILYYGGSFKY